MISCNVFGLYVFQFWGNHLNIQLPCLLIFFVSPVFSLHMVFLITNLTPPTCRDEAPAHHVGFNFFKDRSWIFKVHLLICKSLGTLLHIFYLWSINISLKFFSSKRRPLIFNLYENTTGAAETSFRCPCTLTVRMDTLMSHCNITVSQHVMLSCLSHQIQANPS